MVSFSEYQFWALSLPGAEELPHFEKPSFRVKNKIFGTYWEKEEKAVLMLSPTDQSVFCSYDDTIFYPVNGSWGKKGATFVNMKLVRKDMFKDALKCAYEKVRNKI
jgi:hypothetical protein